MSTELKAIEEITSGLLARVADAERERDAASNAREALEHRAATLEAAVAAANTETWQIARGVVVEDTDFGKVEPRSVAFGPLVLVRKHVGYVLQRDRLPWDGDGLEARLSDELPYEIGCAGRRVFAALSQDDVDALVAWLGGAPKKEKPETKGGSK
jgi:hypothetical protein